MRSAITISSVFVCLFYIFQPVGSTDQKKGYYLWKISESASSDFFLENIYHTAANLNQRIDYHYEENKEVSSSSLTVKLGHFLIL